MVRLLRVGAALVALLCVSGWVATDALADDAVTQARTHYETGLELFYAREHAQALVEFQRAHEIKPRPATLFMMAQCEYLLGTLPTARGHYEAYLQESPAGEFVEVAKDRIESINRRPATLVINCVPDTVDVRITRQAVAPGSESSTAPGSTKAATPPEPSIISGAAPNNFAIPRGRWTVTVSKPNYKAQTITIEVEVAETKPMFFKLDPIPARLEIETLPPGVTLYVNGNRARNPYRQDVPPGHYEIFAEATDYKERTEEISLGPGERRLFVDEHAFLLNYVQRSGRPELLTASALMGAFVGSSAVAASLRRSLGNADVSSVSFTAGGALVGTIAGALLANRALPAYIPDNRALFAIGAMWIGAADGALTGIIVSEVGASVNPKFAVLPGGSGTMYKDSPRLAAPAFWGSLPGLGLGIGAGAMFNNHAPTYGRVALIQSAAAGGALLGALTAITLQWSPFGFQRAVTTGSASISTLTIDPVIDLSIPSALGLNVGLAAGLLGAYLPDQLRYGPSWKRIALIDLAAGAGALAGGIAGCVSQDTCVGNLNAQSSDRARAAGFALLGGAVGLLGGVLLTRNVDRNLPPEERAPKAGSAPPPLLTILPTSSGKGDLAPLFGAVGTF